MVENVNGFDMTKFCENQACPLELNLAPAVPGFITVTKDAMSITVSNQIVDGRRYCDPCAKPIRFKSERDKAEFESSGKAIFFEKVQ